jgi:hypothetical protein
MSMPEYVLVQMSTDFLDGSIWGLRTADGRKIEVEFGEPHNENGYLIYEPIFRSVADEWYLDTYRARAIRDALADLQEALAL